MPDAPLPMPTCKQKQLPAPQLKTTVPRIYTDQDIADSLTPAYKKGPYQKY